MSLFLPFNFNPDTAVPKTGSYTIPTGSYARVVVTDVQSYFRIDGTTVVEQNFFSSNSSTGSTGTKFTNTSNRRLKGYLSQTGTATVQARMNQAAHVLASTTTASTGLPMTLEPDQTIYVSSSSGGTVYWELIADQSGGMYEFWVPQDTDLEGAKYSVELFNIAV